MADSFNEALTHHRAGRLDLAAMLYQATLDENPNHSDSLNLLGVISHQRGDEPAAVDLIRRAIQINPDRAAYHVNLSAAYRGAGRFDEAVESAQMALRLHPGLAEGQLNLGMAHQRAGRWANAEQPLRWVHDNRPDDVRGAKLLGDTLAQLGRMDEATAVYRDAIKRHARVGDLHLALGTLLMFREDYRSAEPYLQRAVKLLPQSVEALINLGSCLVELKRERDALPFYERALEWAPSNPELCVLVGQAWLGCGEREVAENWFNAVLQTNPDHIGALTGRADVFRETERVEESVPLYERALQLDPQCDAYKGLYDALWELGDVDRCIAVLREAVRRHPNQAEVHVRLGSALVTAGDTPGGLECFQAALRILPQHLNTLSELANVLGPKLSDDDRAVLEQAVALPIPEYYRIGAHFGLAKVYDGRGEYARAAEHAERGNALRKNFNEARKFVYHPERHVAFVDKLIEVFTPEFFARTRGFGRDDERPVFVVGMPRSGTTLVEQILASHSQVFGAGERLYGPHGFRRLPRDLGLTNDPLLCFDRLTPEVVRRRADWHLDRLRQVDGGRALRIVDKMPENHSFLGWLALLFPKARFIHCRRDVRDVALSCWMINFLKIRWANDLEHIGTCMAQYGRVMAHWCKVLPVPILEIDYEQLVTNQERESRRLIDWLGLEWEPACLEYYNTKRYVQTASVTQVRQPIYTRSIGRWKNYEQALGPFLQTLAAQDQSQQ
jgi:tetratricopeptide (TPR) repeat protein